jgi:DNA mismatch repair protein MutS
MLDFHVFRRLLSFYLCIIFATSALAIETRDNAFQQSCYSTLSNLYLSSLSQQEAEEKKINEAITTHNIAAIKQHAGKILKTSNTVPLSSIKLPVIGEVEKLNIVYKLFSIDEKISANTINKQTYQDLNFFCGTSEHPTRHLLSKFAPLTVMGKVELQKLLACPITDIKILQERQACLQEIIKQPTLLQNLEKHLSVLHKIESEFLLFWKLSDEASTMLLDRHYFKWLPQLNQNQYALEFSALWEIIGKNLLPMALPIIMTYFQYIIIHHLLPDVARSFNEYLITLTHTFRQLYTWSPKYFSLGILFFITSIAIQMYPTITNAIDYNKSSNLIQQKMINVATFSKTLRLIQKQLAQNTCFASLIKNIKITDDRSDKKLKILQAQLNSKTFREKPSLFSFKGKALAAFKIMNEIKELFGPFLKIAGTIDAFVSVAKMLKSTINNQNAQFCFAEYEVAKTPHLNLTNFWHPILDQNSVVTNNLELGGQGQAANVILTGPNAGGKSTILKGLTIALIFAQTLGIAPASRMIFTPFTQINTYLNIADAEGSESLYQAEMHRAQTLIKSINNLYNNQFSFVIMDEIFTGTNPNEGQAGAYGIAKNLALLDNNVYLVATHYKSLTELENIIPNKVKNCKVYVTKNNDGSYNSPYKLLPGRSDQQIALDMLELEGFDNNIVSDARKELENLNNQHKKITQKE